MNNGNNLTPQPDILSKRVFGHLEIGPFFRVYKILNSIKDDEDLDALTLFYALFLLEPAIPFSPTLLELKIPGLRNTLAVIQWIRGSVDEDWDLKSDDAELSFSYHLLASKQITRAEAAAFATVKLGRPVEQETWRKRVDYWAKVRQFAPIGQTKRRPRK